MWFNCKMGVSRITVDQTLKAASRILFKYFVVVFIALKGSHFWFLFDFTAAGVVPCGGVPVYLAPWTACPPGGKPTAVSLPPGGAGCPGISYPPPWLSSPRGASCPGRFILPPAHAEKILLCDVYYYLQHFNNYMQFLSYKYVNLRWLLQTFSWVSFWQGVGGKLSRAVYLAPHPEFQREWIIRTFYYTIYYRNI